MCKVSLSVFSTIADLRVSCLEKFPYFPDPVPGESLREACARELVPVGNCAEASAAAKLLCDIPNSVDNRKSIDLVFNVENFEDVPVGHRNSYIRI